MFHIARYSGVTAALALLVVGVSSLVMDRSAGLAFAEVQEQVKKVRSVRYIETRTDPQPDGGAPVTSERRHFVLGRYLQRVETLDPDGQPGSISISDAEHGTHVVIQPKTKRFVILATQVSVDFDGSNQIETENKPSTEADIYKVVREVPAEAKPLPGKTIDNRRVLGFLFEEHGGGYTWKRTYWIDAETKLPVRIEISARSNDKRLGPSDWVQAGFVFDETLDTSLFSTTPPAEYTVETQKLLGIRPPN
jgi:outer membrane lipoprotein-sorting protein